jgi:hypothetical protein
MKRKNKFTLLFSFMLVFALLLTTVSQAFAASKTITKDLQADKSLYIPFGRGSVYFWKSSMAGTVIVTRTSPPGYSWYTFTQPVVDVKVYDTSNDQVTEIQGVVYVTFKLTEADREAWDEGNLSIFKFNGWFWSPVSTHFTETGDYGTVTYRIQGSYGKYGLAMMN